MRAMRASFIVLLLVFAVAACGFEAPPAKRTPPPPTPAVPVSTLTATLTVPAATLVETLNDETKTEIAKIHGQKIGCAIAKCTLDLVATRSGEISGGIEDERISLAVPIAVTAQIDMKSLLFKTKVNSVAAGLVKSETAIALGGDWRLATQTEGSVDLDQAIIKLGPLKMSFAEIWNRNQEALSRPLFRSLDKQLTQSVKLRPQAQRLWLKAQRPIRIGKSPPAWLVLAPQRVRISAPVLRAGNFVLSFGVDVRAHVVVSDDPPQVNIDTALPAPAPMTSPSDRFSLVIPILLPYADASRLAMQRLATAPLKVGGQNIRFEALQILPSGSDVVVAAGFCVTQSWDPFGLFDSCGEGYLRGTPQFDAQPGTIRIVNVHYDIATEGMLLSIMRYLAGEQLSKALETKLVFPVAKDIAKLDDELKTALARPQGRGVLISGDVQSFGKPSLAWTADGFLATFPAEGTIRADLNLKSKNPFDER